MALVLALLMAVVLALRLALLLALRSCRHSLIILGYNECIIALN